MQYTQTLINLEAVIKTAHNLKPLPASLTRLWSIVNSAQYSIGDVVEVIRLDQALTMNLLKAANSAVYSAGKGEVYTAEQAVERLGGKEVLNLAMASELKDKMKDNASGYGYDEGALWKHSVATALATETMGFFTHASIAAECFTAALLHDVGKLILSRFLDADTLRLLKLARDEGGLSFLEAESQVLQVHHGEVGGIIAQHWKLPERIMKAIIYHHSPEQASHAICDTVHIANLVAKTLDAEYEWTDCWQQCAATSIERLRLSKETFHDYCEALPIKMQASQKIYQLS